MKKQELLKIVSTLALFCTLLGGCSRTGPSLSAAESASESSGSSEAAPSASSSSGAASASAQPQLQALTQQDLQALWQRLTQDDVVWALADEAQWEAESAVTGFWRPVYRFVNSETMPFALMVYSAGGSGATVFYFDGGQWDGQGEYRLLCGRVATEGHETRFDEGAQVLYTLRFSDGGLQMGMTRPDAHVTFVPDSAYEMSGGYDRAALAGEQEQDRLAQEADEYGMVELDGSNEYLLSGSQMPDSAYRSYTPAQLEEVMRNL